jgi:UDP-glucose 4-epimerase
VEAEASVDEFARKNPQASVTILRFANVLGPSVRTSHVELLSLPVVPMILGFDPRYQFAHEDDVVHALEHVAQRSLPGVYNVAADGVLALSEVAGLLGKPYLPLLPPWGTGLAAGALRRLGLRIPPEVLGQLRFGRGVDNRRLKATGFRFGYTSRETVLALGEHFRLLPIRRGESEPYRYEREVEEFLRWSPHVRNSGTRSAPALTPGQLRELGRLLAAYGDASALASSSEAAQPTQRNEGAAARAPVERYDDLEAEEVIPLLGRLAREDLIALREYEREHLGREAVIGAIGSVLTRRREPAPD